MPQAEGAWIPRKSQAASRSIPSHASRTLVGSSSSSSSRSNTPASAIAPAEDNNQSWCDPRALFTMPWDAGSALRRLASAATRAKSDSDSDSDATLVITLDLDSDRDSDSGENTTHGNAKGIASGLRDTFKNSIKASKAKTGRRDSATTSNSSASGSRRRRRSSNSKNGAKNEVTEAEEGGELGDPWDTEEAVSPRPIVPDSYRRRARTAGARMSRRLGLGDDASESPAERLRRAAWALSPGGSGGATSVSTPNPALQRSASFDDALEESASAADTDNADTESLDSGNRGAPPLARARSVPTWLGVTAGPLRSSSSRRHRTPNKYGSGGLGPKDTPGPGEGGREGSEEEEEQEDTAASGSRSSGRSSGRSRGEEENGRSSYGTDRSGASAGKEQNGKGNRRSGNSSRSSRQSGNVGGKAALLGRLGTRIRTSTRSLASTAYADIAAAAVSGSRRLRGGTKSLPNKASADANKDHLDDLENVSEEGHKDDQGNDREITHGFEHGRNLQGLSGRFDSSGKRIASSAGTMGEHVVRKILEGATVADVVAPQRAESSGKELIYAVEDDKVLDVCTKLAESGISSLPVFTEDKSDCVGLVDFSDAVAYLLKMDWESIGSVPSTTNVWHQLGMVAVAEAIDLSTRNPKVTIKENASLMEAVTLFHKMKLRRALVEAADSDEIVAVLSPSALVQYIMINVQGRDDIILSDSVSNLGVGHSPVKSVKKTQTVLEAMHLMHQTRHSVVAVVDPSTGVLSGSISMSDIQYVFQEKRFSLLVTTCWKYIIEARERSDMEVFPYFGVNEEDKLQMVVSKLLATNVHHLYVVDDAQVPNRVISFTDVCSTFYENYIGEEDDDDEGEEDA